MRHAKGVRALARLLLFGSFCNMACSPGLCASPGARLRRICTQRIAGHVHILINGTLQGADIFTARMRRRPTEKSRGAKTLNNGPLNFYAQ